MVLELNMHVEYEGDGASFENSVRGVFRKDQLALRRIVEGVFVSGLIELYHIL